MFLPHKAEISARARLDTQTAIHRQEPLLFYFS